VTNSTNATPTNIALTGASGFLGRAIVETAVAHGLNVGALTRNTNAHRKGPSGRVTTHAYDPRTGDGLAEAFASTDTVIHAAGIAHRARGTVSEASYLADNGQACATVVAAAAAAGVRHVLFVSSISVYGDTHGETFDESAPCHPLGPYAASKYLGEQVAVETGHRHNIPVTVLRLATVFGHEDPGNLVRLIRAVDRRRFVWIGSGHNRKTLIHRNDAAKAFVRAAQAGPQTQTVYNVGAAIYTLADIVTTIADALDRRLPPLRLPEGWARGASRLLHPIGTRGSRVAASIERWLGDDAHTSERFATTYGFSPGVSLAAGIADECAWYRDVQRSSTNR